MIEKIIEKTKTGIAIAALGITMYGCASTRVNSPIAEYIRENDRQKCYDMNMEETKENNCVYPVIVIKF